MEFTSEQIAEARDVLRGSLGDWINDIPEIGKLQLVQLYFKLKQVKFELKPNQFIIGLDYSADSTVGIKGVKISFHSPLPESSTDTFARDTLIKLLKTLVKPK